GLGQKVLPYELFSSFVSRTLAPASENSVMRAPLDASTTIFRSPSCNVYRSPLLVADTGVYEGGLSPLPQAPRHANERIENACARQHARIASRYHRACGRSSRRRGKRSHLTTTVAVVKSIVPVLS